MGRRRLYSPPNYPLLYYTFPQCDPLSTFNDGHKFDGDIHKFGYDLDGHKFDGDIHDIGHEFDGYDGDI